MIQLPPCLEESALKQIKTVIIDIYSKVIADQNYVELDSKILEMYFIFNTLDFSIFSIKTSKISDKKQLN